MTPGAASMATKGYYVPRAQSEEAFLKGVPKAIVVAVLVDPAGLEEALRAHNLTARAQEFAEVTRR